MQGAALVEKKSTWLDLDLPKFNLQVQVRLASSKKSSRDGVSFFSLNEIHAYSIWINFMYEKWTAHGDEYGLLKTRSKPLQSCLLNGTNDRIWWSIDSPLSKRVRMNRFATSGFWVTHYDSPGLLIFPTCVVPETFICSSIEFKFISKEENLSQERNSWN